MVGDREELPGRAWGYVLAGGRSRRMGLSKAEAELGGRPLAAWPVEALQAGGCDVITFVGGDAALADELGVGWLGDRWPGQGPLAGALTALAHAGTSDALIVACDMPWITGSIVRSLLAVETGADVVLARAGEHRQPLLGRYRPRARVGLERAYRAGERSLSRALDALEVHEVAVAAAVVADVDTPHDLGAARARVAASDRRGHSGEIIDDTQPPEIDVHELARRRAGGGPILDVRQLDEYVEAHVPGADLIPLDELADRVDEVPPGQPLSVICRSGARSRAAGEFLRQRGVEAVNVAGGMLAWIEAGFEVDTGPPAAP